MKHKKEVAEYILANWKYDPETGAVFGVKGRPIGNITYGYLFTVINFKPKPIRVRMHRVAWLLMTGAWPLEQIDHINGVRSDNRWTNLRQATPAENRQNVVMKKRDLPQGVSRCPMNKNRFRVEIHVNGERAFHGRFNTLEEATQKAVEVKAQFHTFNRVQRVV